MNVTELRLLFEDLEWIHRNVQWVNDREDHHSLTCRLDSIEARVSSCIERLETLIQETEGEK